MNMKTLYAFSVAALLSLGSVASLAQGWSDDQSTTGGSDNSAFSVIDQNGDGSIDKNEAKNSGISDSRFESMDANGDGVVSQSEYEG